MKTTTHCQVTAELMTDEKGPLISLEQQDGINDPTAVYLHPWQLRNILEQFGVIAADKESAKTIATLERRLLVLRDRLADLHSYMVNHSDHKHADLSYEMTLLSASLDIADEFCHDLPTPANSAPLQPIQTTAAPECSPAPTKTDKQQSIDF